jgi:nucleoside-diphosphate-sugar epimerase
MTASRRIAVFGATDAQGGGLARAILDDTEGGFSVRAITRHVDYGKARELPAAGAEGWPRISTRRRASSMRCPRLQSFAQWLQANADRIPVAG